MSNFFNKNQNLFCYFIVSERKKKFKVKKTANIQSFILKKTLIVLALCYLFVPLQKPLVNVVHTFSHAMFSKQMKKNTHDSHDFASKDHHDNHENNHSFHKHELLEFIQQFFSSESSDNSAGEDYIVTTIIDKHITIQQYVIQHTILNTSLTSIAWSIEKKLCKGYLKDVRHPPTQNIS